MTEPSSDWYARIGAKYLDIVGDYAGKERFFIEGDSLLLECLSNPQLDFHPGFQLLHAVYLVEQYLYNLQRRSCSFDIVFFEAHSDLCIPAGATSNASKYLLARRVIINHLQHHGDSVNSYVFIDSDDSRFSEYLQDSAVYFGMCSDGASYKYLKQKALHLQNHAVRNDTNESGYSDDQADRLRENIYKLMHVNALDIALLNGLVWQDSKVFAFVLERKSRSRQSPHSISPTESRLARPATNVQTPTTDEDVPISAANIIRSANMDVSCRLQTTLQALACLSDRWSPFILPHLLQTLLLDCLPLCARSLPSVAFAPEAEHMLDDYLNAFARLCTESLQKTSHDQDDTRIDLVDGRLLRMTIHMSNASPELLPAKLVDVARRLANELQGSGTSPFAASSIRAAPRASLPDSEVLPFSHPAFDKHLSAIHIRVNNNKSHHAGRLARELTHWHNSKMLVLARGPKTKRPPEEEKRAQRQHQRRIAQLTGYACSLTGTVTRSLDPKLIQVNDASSVKTRKKAFNHVLQERPKNAGQKQPLQSSKRMEVKALQQKGKARKQGGKQESETRPLQEATLTTKQLLDCLQNDGPQLDRSMDAREDERVPFKPDAWQVKVLDEIDQGNSLLVTAPTSAGKTFISFYAMEKALRVSDDAVLVYVAPTKALVNQIAAEVLAKFKKRYPHPGPSVYAIFTRDHRLHDPLKAQILVTVPHILQIMLMSASSKSWVPRIKTIIFDEVHSVSQADDGLVWEQLLISAPSQIIALSATIGNTAEFGSWLSAMQASTGRKLSLIQHDARYSDLRKYVYMPDNTSVNLRNGLPDAMRSEQSKTVGVDSVSGFVRVHPIACLNHPQRGMPPDLTLESDDCLTLWQTMDKLQDATYPVPVQLSPAQFFGSKKPVKADILNWGAELKALLMKWMVEREGSPFFAVVRALRERNEGSHRESKSTQSHEEGVQVMTLDHPEAKRVDKTSKRLLATTLPMLCELRANDALPAILFHFDRAGCEDIATHLLDQMAEAEEKFKSSDMEWQANIKRFTEWQKNAPARERQARAAEKQNSTKSKGDGKAKDALRDSLGSKDQRAHQVHSAKDLWFESFDPEVPLDQFSFTDIRNSDRELLETSIMHMKRVEIPEKLIDAFRRGIGVHHAGMNLWYRQAVEIFFRRGYLTVVIATGTLSLGINMPCKTVVFSGDSAYLSALNYRQCSGRAGRRGFDLLGNVIFQDMPTDKALRLMSSKLPDINGHFPLTTVFVLRLLSLLHGTSNAKYAMNMVDALLSKPRLLQGGNDFKQQVLHHIRYSIEYLRSQDLLSAEGHPIGFASCVSHLYFVESSAFAFHALLKAGFFHDMAQEHQGSGERTLRKLMVVLSHLFGRRPMRTIGSEEEKEVIKKSVSLVFLPEMPAEASTILHEHNQQTLRTYQSYVSTFVDQHCKEPDITLPLTQTTINARQVCGAKSLPEGLPPTRMRSPFVALSGRTDQFDSVSELCETVRSGVFLEKAVIPHLDMGGELAAPLNAYLYDFFISGSVKALLEVNRIPRGDLWFLLKDFSLIVATIVTSIENFLNPKNDGDMELAEEDGIEEEQVEENASVAGSKKSEDADFSDEGSHDASHGPPEIGTTTSETSRRAKKAKVTDSWDDDESDAEQSQRGTSQASSKDQAKAGEQAEKELRQVHKMFKALQDEFETKFKRMWV